MHITQDKVVEIDYVLKVDGEVVDASEPGEPLTYREAVERAIAEEKR